jgi:AcrR family transcriptional regulator
MAAATPALTMDQEMRRRQPLVNKTEWPLRFCYRGRMARATSTRSDARRNRERLVTAARELFAKQGVDVSVEEITHHAGVGMGTLYRHFPTKAELVDAVLEDAFDEMLALAERATREEDAWAGFTGFLERALELRVQNRGVKDLLASPEHGVRHAEMRRRIRPLMRRLIERAQAQGTLRADFTLDDLSSVFRSVAGVIEMTEDVSRTSWRRVLGFLLDGLRASAATSVPRTRR